LLNKILTVHRQVTVSNVHRMEKGLGKKGEFHP
jgi:hypothetical protein